MEHSILVVGNKPCTQMHFRSILPGHKIEFAKSGAAAIKAAFQSQPAVIVMDIALPHSSGFEVCGKLQASRKTRDIPVLFMTDPALRAQGLPEASEYIIEMADLITLKQRIEVLIEESVQARAFHEVYREIAGNLAKDPEREFSESESKELTEGGFPVKAKVNYRPIAERAAEYATLVNSSLTTSQAAKRLGVNTSRIRQRLLSRPPTLYGIRQNDEWILPAFQFQEKGLVPNINKIIVSLDPGLDLIAITRWLTKPNPDLLYENEEVAPLDWLRQGLSWELVAALAENL